MGKGRSGRSNRDNQQRDINTITNELDSLLQNSDRYLSGIREAFKPMPDETIEITSRDRRYTAPSPPSMARQRSLAVNRGFSILHPVESYKYLVCKRRKERKQVLHAMYKKRGGVGAARKYFKHPIRTLNSKIKC